MPDGATFSREPLALQEAWLASPKARPICVGGPSRPLAPFAYSGPLTETVLLSTVTVRFPHTTLEWNAQALRFENVEDANAFLRRRYRPGWEIAGM